MSKKLNLILSEITGLKEQFNRSETKGDVRFEFIKDEFRLVRTDIHQLSEGQKEHTRDLQTLALEVGKLTKGHQKLSISMGSLSEDVELATGLSSLTDDVGILKAGQNSLAKGQTAILREMRQGFTDVRQDIASIRDQTGNLTERVVILEKRLAP